MLPLHGLSYVLEAAILLKSQPVEFTIVGGGQKTAEIIKSASQKGARITYWDWLEFRDLPGQIDQASLCLGGPFGGTVQANHVITGKTYQFLASAAPTLVGQNQATTLFKDKDNCLKVPQQNGQALAAAIEWALNHQSKLAEIGHRGQDLYQKHFSNAVVTDDLTAILKSLA
jgi:hypothetical protein